MAGAISVALRMRSGINALSSSALLSASANHKQPKCNFISKALRDPDYKKPTPWPYEKKNYNLLRAMFDDVTPRIDENSKIIVVDGPPTGGKTELAKTIADELDLLHIGPPNLDDLYVQGYGIDLRTLNPQMPRKCRTVDIHEFLEKPTPRISSRLQYNLLLVKFEQYMKAIAHVLNTGQGVVMNRSIYSDFVFVDTLVKHNFIKETARTYLNQCKENGMFEFMRPHLLIYLDIPVDKVIDNVKSRNIPYEQNAAFYAPEVLKTLERIYKNEYLTKMRSHCEIMVYDWSEGGDADIVVEDICRLDMDKYTKFDTQFEDWYFRDEWDWKYKRIMFSDSNFKEQMRSWLNVPRYTCEELIIPGQDVLEYDKVIERTPGLRYDYGFNRDKGDNIWFKNTFYN